MLLRAQAFCVYIDFLMTWKAIYGQDSGVGTVVDKTSKQEIMSTRFINGPTWQIDIVLLYVRSNCWEVQDRDSGGKLWLLTFLKPKVYIILLLAKNFFISNATKD